MGEGQSDNQPGGKESNMSDANANPVAADRKPEQLANELERLAAEYVVNAKQIRTDSGIRHEWETPKSDIGVSPEAIRIHDGQWQVGRAIVERMGAAIVANGMAEYVAAMAPVTDADNSEDERKAAPVALALIQAATIANPERLTELFAEARRRAERVISLDGKLKETFCAIVDEWHRRHMPGLLELLEQIVGRLEMTPDEVRSSKFRVFGSPRRTLRG